jgi:hypothetical protein
MHMSSIVELFPDDQYDFVDWLDIPFVWHCLKTLKHAINEDKPLRKFGIWEILNTEYTYLFNDQTRDVINQRLLLINLRLIYLIIKYFGT